MFDSLGASHTASYYFVKTGGPLTIRVGCVAVCGRHPRGRAADNRLQPDGSLSAPPGPPLGEFTFGPIALNNGAADLNLTTDLSDATQFGDSFTVNELTQDGFESGRLSGIDVSQEGVVFAQFTNGQSDALGKLALADFANVQGLANEGNTSFTETFESGQALLGEAGTSSLGLVESGALEASNVNLTEELVQMITAQRNFQANAQMISTADTIAQTIINIR